MARTLWARTAATLLTVSLLFTKANAVSSIGSTSLVVIRLGDSTHPAATDTAGTAEPVYVDEYLPGASSATLVQSIAASTTQCALATGSNTLTWWDQEGWPTVSGNTFLVTFPCHVVTALGTAIGTGASPMRTVAMLRSDGTIDTSTHTDRPYLSGTGPTGKLAMHNAVTQDGTSFLFTSGIGYT